MAPAALRRTLCLLSLLPAAAGLRRHGHGCTHYVTFSFLGFGADANSCGGGITLFGIRVGGSPLGAEVGTSWGVGAGVGPVRAVAGVKADVTIGKEVSLRGTAHASAHAVVGAGAEAAAKGGYNWKDGMIAGAGAHAGSGVLIASTQDKLSAKSAFVPEFAGASATAGWSERGGAKAGASAHVGGILTKRVDASAGEHFLQAK